MSEAPAYLLLRRKVTDPEQARRYLEGAAPVVHSYGGEYLVRGDAGEAWEGEPLDDGFAFVVIRFPSVARVREFHDSEEYKPWLDLAQTAFDREMFMVQGLAEQPS